jgi:hypothetical protein
MKTKMPEEIKTRFRARKECHPTKVVWAMLSNECWYIYAHTQRVANRYMKEYEAQGFEVYKEIK